MMTEYLSYPESVRAISVLDDLASREREYALYNVQYLYVVRRNGRLTGVLRLRDLVHADRNARLRQLAVPATVIDASSDLVQLHEFFETHNLSAVPVVDADMRLLGVVRAIDVTEAIAERDAADRLKSQGIVGGEELRSMPLMTRSKRRLSWLSVNVLLNLMAASVIAFFEDTISAVVALAVFLPIVSDMSGCSGNQAVAVSMRELTLGIVRPADVVRVWLREVSVGLINGLVLGTLLALAVWAWRGNIWLGLVVGVALALNTVVAVSVGGVVPLVLRGIRVDPAIASGPLLTTITDMVGFFFVLGFATLMLPLLVQ
jgi:magnesium transporter